VVDRCGGCRACCFCTVAVPFAPVQQPQGDVGSGAIEREVGERKPAGVDAGCKGGTLEGAGGGLYGSDAALLCLSVQLKVAGRCRPRDSKRKGTAGAGIAASSRGWRAAQARAPLAGDAGGAGVDARAEAALFELFFVLLPPDRLQPRLCSRRW
jgi:hypothetical protein